MNNGALIAVPIPMEYEKIGMTIQKAVDQAVTEAEANGVSKRGKEATPWLLMRVNELTKGDSLESNIALLKNTALVGECICAYWRLKFHGFVQAEK
jgi:pseudouridine-5'-phosphate glycosidase/pseudouridine kinase